MKNKIGTILLAFVVAFSMWYYVITVVSPEQERPFSNVPVTLEGESQLRERGLMLISDPNPTVRVELKGSRQDLNNLNSGNLTLTADLSGIFDAGEYQLGYSVEYPGNIPSGSVTVMNKEPSAVTVVVAERITRNIPVQLEFVGDAAEGFIADKPQAELDYQEVSITGPKETVDQIDHAYVRVDCTDRTETITESYRFELQDAEGKPVDAALITTNVEQIKVRVPVFLTKRLDLVVTANPGGGATAETSSIVIEPAYIDVSGSESALKDLSEIILGTLNLGEITDSMEKTIPITLPEGVNNLSNITEATVKISFPELAKKTFTITNIQANNVPEGMDLDVLTKQLDITVRGPKDLIAKLTPEQIHVAIDVAGVDNTDVVAAQITFPEEFAGVGAVGKYSVSVKVSPIQDSEE